MKKKTGVILGAVVVLAVGAVIWFFMPKRFLGRYTAAEITEISVFDGNTGQGFQIDDPERIAYIVEEIQGTDMKRGGLALGHMGYRFRLTFFGKKGETLETFILNGQDRIRSNLFFYTSQEILRCFEYLEQLEERADQYTFRAVVQEIGNGFMLVEPVPEADERRSADLISIGGASVPTSPEPQVGDTVVIVYDGQIKETYPAQLGKIYSITIE